MEERRELKNLKNNRKLINDIVTFGFNSRKDYKEKKSLILQTMIWKSKDLIHYILTMILVISCCQKHQKRLLPKHKREISCHLFSACYQG